MQPRLRCDETPAWQVLRQQAGHRFDLNGAFAADTGRFEAFSQQPPHVFADLSKNRVDRTIQSLLFRLAGRLPAYLQQLEMESNGKRVDLRGNPLSLAARRCSGASRAPTASTHISRCCTRAPNVVPEVHCRQARFPPTGAAPALLLANALAQAQALMQGRADAGGHRDFPGDRPSTSLLLDELTSGDTSGLDGSTAGLLRRLNVSG